MPRRAKGGVELLAFALLALASACDAYDAGLLSARDDALSAQSISGEGDAGPGADPEIDADVAVGVDAGDAGDTVDTVDTAVPDPDEDAGTGESDSGAGVVGQGDVRQTITCGDGLVGGDETCDIGIEAGQPGACPSECPALSPCERRVLRGEGCDAACVLLPPSCADDDDCCPGICGYENDNDCSRNCGDGELQPEEMCEDGTDTPCPTEADCDDDEPCTRDSLLGSADNCSAECAHETITQLTVGDGCCPEGANNNSDPDCPEWCGNGIREGSEECDGVPGCSDDCVVTETPRQLECLDRLASDSCLECACISCTEDVFGCYDSGDEERDMHCSNINTCARANDCTGGACYCADALCWVPGPCFDPIANAATEYTNESVTEDRDNPEKAIGRAYILGQCAVTNCSDVCP